jgi:hypothetical protein
MKNNEELSLVQLIEGLVRQLKLLKRNILWILLPAIILGLGAYYLENSSPTYYTARASFSIQSNNQNGISTALSIANQFGIKVGDVEDVNNYTLAAISTSKSSIFTALLNTYQNNNDELLLNRFFKIDKKYNKNYDKFKFKNKNYDIYNLNEFDDSILTEVHRKLLKEYIDVVVDEKENIVDYSITSTDRTFSKEFGNRILHYVNYYFTENKLRQQSFTIDLMQNKADSIFRLLKTKQMELAMHSDANSKMIKNVGKLGQVSLSIDVAMLQEMYVNAVKNLELSKLSMQSTNIEHLFIVDEPNISIESVEKYPFKKAVIAFLLGAIIAAFIILLKAYIQDLLINEV